MFTGQKFVYYTKGPNMIDLPIGKALIAVLTGKECGQKCMNEDYHCPNYMDCCDGCKINLEDVGGLRDDDVCGCLSCCAVSRKDGKHVIYKLVDYPVENNSQQR